MNGDADSDESEALHSHLLGTGRGPVQRVCAQKEELLVDFSCAVVFLGVPSPRRPSELTFSSQTGVVMTGCFSRTRALAHSRTRALAHSRTRALAIVALLSFAVHSANAQSLIIGCIVGGTENGIDVNGGSVGLIVSDAVTGEQLWPAAGSGGYHPITETNGSHTGDFFLDTNSPSVTVPHLNSGGNILFLPTRLYVLTFVPMGSNTVSQSINIAWNGATNGPSTGQTPLRAFYRPQSNDSNVDTCMRLVNGVMKVATEDLAVASGYGGFINDALGAGGWTMPYDAWGNAIRKLCPGFQCATDLAQTVGQFVAYDVAVASGSSGPRALVPDFRFKDPRVPATAPSLTWDVPSMVGRFTTSTPFLVQGTLNVQGATFTSSLPATTWGGLTVSSGGHLTLGLGSIIEKVQGTAAHPEVPPYFEPRDMLVLTPG